MAQKQGYLSKNQKIVLDYIEKANQPLKAYSILFNVQKNISCTNSNNQTYEEKYKIISKTKMVWNIANTILSFLDYVKSVDKLLSKSK